MTAKTPKKARKIVKVRQQSRLAVAEANITFLARYINGYRRDTGESPEPPRYLPRGIALFADGLGVCMDVPARGVSLHLRTNEDESAPAYIVDIYLGLTNSEAPWRLLGSVQVPVPHNDERHTVAIGAAVESAIALDRTIQRHLAK